MPHISKSPSIRIVDVIFNELPHSSLSLTAIDDLPNIKVATCDNGDMFTFFTPYTDSSIEISTISL